MWDGKSQSSSGKQRRQGKAFLWLCRGFVDLLSLDKAGPCSLESLQSWLECVSLDLIPAPDSGVKQQFCCKTPPKLGCALKAALVSSQPENYPQLSKNSDYCSCTPSLLFCTQSLSLGQQGLRGGWKSQKCPGGILQAPLTADPFLHLV